MKNNRGKYSDTDLYALARVICHKNKLGEIRRHLLVNIGFEDYNLQVLTTKGQYYIKFLSDNHTQEEIIKYGRLIRIIDKSKIKTTKFYGLKHLGQDQYIISNALSDARSIYVKRKAPNTEELASLVTELNKLHKIKYKLPCSYSPWSINSFRGTSTAIAKYLSKSDLKILEKVNKIYDNLDFSDLPKCFIHSDLTKTNVFTENGKIYLLDFFCSGYDYRILDIAVVLANLMYDECSYVSLTDRISKFLNMYDDLCSIEKQQLKNFALVAAAMEWYGALYEKYYRNKATNETKYWINLSKTTLQNEL